MKRKNIVAIAFGISFMMAGITMIPNSAEACKPGEVYEEGDRFVFCWGTDGSDCAKCKKVELKPA